MSDTKPNPGIAVYAGSFDPPTIGHLRVIRRGAGIFERLIVAVSNNPRKRYLFTAAERTEMLARELADHENIEVLAFEGLLVDFCCEVNAGVILRGLRAVADFEFEFQMGLANMDLEPQIDTLFLLAGPETLFVSSSIVLEIASGGRDVSRYVPQHVADALRAKLASEG